jgi:hypothetical protein
MFAVNRLESKFAMKIGLAAAHRRGSVWIQKYSGDIRVAPGVPMGMIQAMDLERKTVTMCLNGQMEEELTTHDAEKTWKADIENLSEMGDW